MRILFFLIATSILFQSCGTPADNPRFIETRTFSFTAAIDPSTLIQEQRIVNIHSSSTYTRSSSYTIGSSGDLDAFNATLGAGEQPLALSNLDTLTYFLIQEPACPEYYVYTGNSYSNGILVIAANLYILDGGLCADDIFI